MKTMPLRQRRQHGSSLLEVLISVMILAVGMLSLASLQINTLRWQKTAEFRSSATQLAYDMSDRMRGNMVGIRGGADANAAPAPSYYFTTETYADASTGAFPDPGCAAPTCTPLETAQRDIANWQRTVKMQLPGGAGFIAGDMTQGFRITVAWAEPGSVATDAACAELSSAAAVPINSGIRCFVTTLLP